MRTKVLLGAAVVLMLVVSVATIGSNMGFKISIPVTASQNQFVSLPYYCTIDGQVVGAGATAANLRNELIAAGSSSTVGQTPVFYFNGSVWQRYAGGGIGQVNFPLQPGVGYEIITTAALNWVVVGSHNPSLGVVLPASQSSFISVPYHTTAVTAADLRNELIAAGSSATVGQTPVFYFNGSVWQRYAGGGIGQVNFNIIPGTAYQVIVSSTVTWTPAHY